MNTRVWPAGLLTVLLALIPLGPASVHAASTVSVSTCDESHLLGAISSAGAGGTVTFSCSGTITLAATITFDGSLSGLTIDGSGQAVTISGANSVRVFHNSGVSVTLNDLTIANGSAGRGVGGGVLNQGTLTVTDSTFSSNRGSYGSGVYNLGTLTLTNSTFSNNFAVSGTIENGGTLTVTNGTFSGNTSEEGGGILNYGTLSVSNGTFSGNSATFVGGGILNSGTLNVSNSTFSGNSAGTYGGGIGGGIANWGTLTVTNSTFSGNSATVEGSGIFTCYVDLCNRLGSTTLANTLLATSSAAGGDCGGTAVTDNGGNLADDGTCGVTQVSTAALNLGSLADNGGPTQTIALLPGSVAIDSTSCLQPTDQRGFPRPDGAETACDAGAYEFQDDAVAQISDLIGVILGFGLAQGLQTSLQAELEAAGAALQTGQSAPACGVLVAFGNEVAAQTGKLLTAAQAQQVGGAAVQIRAVLGC